MSVDHAGASLAQKRNYTEEPPPVAEPMNPGTVSHSERLATLLRDALRPPPGDARIALALLYGGVCHLAFAAGGAAMVVAMFFGMSESLGRVAHPWQIVANALLLVQFPLAHSFLLTTRGSRWLARLAPSPHGATLVTTTYASIAAVQLLALFTLWTPSGIVWWRAEGWALVAVTCASASAWLLLAKASFDAGAEVQSGALGWLSLLQARRPVFPDLPTEGLFRYIRHPIYVAFALTTWTVAVWTPDQLLLATTLTAYCLLAPIRKERRLRARHGERFEAYRARVPYALPVLPGRRRPGS